MGGSSSTLIDATFDGVFWVLFLFKGGSKHGGRVYMRRGTK
jgi:hypothetical protein